MHVLICHKNMHTHTHTHTHTYTRIVNIAIYRTYILSVVVFVCTLTVFWGQMYTQKWVKLAYTYVQYKNHYDMECHHLAK